MTSSEKVPSAAASASDPSEAWRALLEAPGEYEHSCSSQSDFNHVRRLGWAWRRILRKVQLKPGARVFELGCGGGKHLATLAANGFDVHGIDVSEQVAQRAREYLESVARFAPIKAAVSVANILDYDVQPEREQYDLCFHAGVIEHFLDDRQRAHIWGKMCALTKPGGWVASLVPGGKHLLRQHLRSHKVGGYGVPEIDYGCAMHREEFEAAGLQNISCMAHNYLAFLPVHPSPILSGRLARPLILIANATLPWLPVSEGWKERFASTLLVVGQKPLSAAGEQRRYD